MSEMIERMARAIWWSDHGRNPLELQPEIVQEEFRRRAHAALTILRQPTEAMVKAGFDFAGGEACRVEDTAKAWQAMIDEALKA